MVAFGNRTTIIAVMDSFPCSQRAVSVTRSIRDITKGKFQGEH